MRLIRSLFSLAVIIALVYFATAIPLGKLTLWQHLRAIAGSKESQELVDEVKQKAQQVVKSDSGGEPASPQEDNLTPQERKQLRKLIRQKMEQDKDPSPAPVPASEE